MPRLTVPPSEKDSFSPSIATTVSGDYNRHACDCRFIVAKNGIVVFSPHV
jgi:hypothetical protein